MAEAEKPARGLITLHTRSPSRKQQANSEACSDPQDEVVAHRTAGAETASSPAVAAEAAPPADVGTPTKVESRQTTSADSGSLASSLSPCRTAPHGFASAPASPLPDKAKATARARASSPGGDRDRDRCGAMRELLAQQMAAVQLLLAESSERIIARQHEDFADLQATILGLTSENEELRESVSSRGIDSSLPSSGAAPLPALVSGSSNTSPPPLLAIAAALASVAQTNGATMAIGICPAGHALTAFQTHHPNFGCNACRKGLPQGARMYGCRSCNWDVCDDCKPKEHMPTPPTQPPPLLMQPRTPIERAFTGISAESPLEVEPSDKVHGVHGATTPPDVPGLVLNRSESDHSVLLSSVPSVNEVVSKISGEQQMQVSIISTHPWNSSRPSLAAATRGQVVPNADDASAGTGSAVKLEDCFTRRANSKISSDPRKGVSNRSPVPLHPSPGQAADGNNVQASSSGPRGGFLDADRLKKKLKEAIGKKPYSVVDFYYETGHFQAVAQDYRFENLTLLVISLNAIWIGIDADWNTAEPGQAHPFFGIVENLFCVYFTLELVTRFGAFANKLNCMKDPWFAFDSILVFCMVVETWVVPLLAAMPVNSGQEGMGNASILRLFRLLRLTRMARMVRLLRAMPELMVMVKALFIALRSVFFALILLVGIIYAFSIVFKQLLEGSEVGEADFPTILFSMNTLLLHGAMPDQVDVVNRLGDHHLFFRLLMLFYLFLTTLCLMNMLIGILCEVIAVVSNVEKEEMLINWIKHELQKMLVQCGIDIGEDVRISRSEFNRLIETPGAANALNEVGVDVGSLVDFTEMVFYDGRSLSFVDFFDMVLQLRGSNTATVKDIVDLRKLLVVEIASVTKCVTELLGGEYNANDTATKLGGMFTRERSRHFTNG